MVNSTPLPKLTALAQRYVSETLLGTGWFTAPGALAHEYLRLVSFRNVRIGTTSQGWPDPMILAVSAANLYVLPVLEIHLRTRAVPFEEWYKVAPPIEILALRDLTITIERHALTYLVGIHHADGRVWEAQIKRQGNNRIPTRDLLKMMGASRPDR